MLLDDLSSTVKRLSQLDKKESAIQNAAKKAQNDSEFSLLTSDYYDCMQKLKYAHDELGYVLSNDSYDLLSDSLTKLEDTIDAGVVDEELLRVTKQQINKKLNQALSKEWREFHSKKTNSVVGKLATVGSLASDKDHINTIRDNINDSADWNALSNNINAATTKIMRFKFSIDEVDKIEEELNLNDEIKRFITLVTRGKAKITDLNDEIMAWIENENLADKFTIRFK